MAAACLEMDKPLQNGGKQSENERNGRQLERESGRVGEWEWAAAGLNIVEKLSISIWKARLVGGHS